MVPERRPSGFTAKVYRATAFANPRKALRPSWNMERVSTQYVNWAHKTPSFILGYTKRQDFRERRFVLMSSFSALACSNFTFLEAAILMASPGWGRFDQKRYQGRIHRADNLCGNEFDLDLSLEILSQTPLDQPRSKSPPLRGLTGGPALSSQRRCRRGGSRVSSSGQRMSIPRFRSRAPHASPRSLQVSAAPWR